MQAPLTHWLRLLWGRAPALHLDSEAPFISGGEIHLPRCSRWQQHRAAAAHAAAHLVYSPPRFDSQGLVPLARMLLALLEDARVESLAGRELPGLSRLWRSQHEATPGSGAGAEALMQRLARALADPAYADPHPWVAKGRRLFFLDAGQALLALRTADELRQVASRLGHDLGQMRLPFNARTYRPQPAYRDDHRWMWDADDLAAATPPPQPQACDATGPPDAPADLPPHVSRHPEWDRLIQRLRRDWCTVIEQPAPAGAATLAALAAFSDAAERLGRRLDAPLHSLVRPTGRRRCSADGDHFDLDALVSWRVARRLGRPGDARVYAVHPRALPRAAVWLLVDCSASAAAGHGAAGHSQLKAAALAAAAAVAALQRLGLACGVAGFSSYGRHAVHVHTFKALDDGADSGLAQRLLGLRSGGSTRLGAALRHAGAQLQAAAGGRRGGARWVLLLSDGQPHDVDIHDPQYLVEDARHAVREGARHALRMACLTLAPEGAGSARRIFGRRGTQPVETLDALPRALKRLLA